MPKPLRPRTTFLIAILAGTAGTMGLAAWENRPTARTASVAAPASPSAAFASRHRVSERIWVAAQLETGDVAVARAEGFRAVIGLRPDGEEPAQPPANALAAYAGAEGLAFAHVPVPQGELPDAVADALGAALARVDGPVLLTCRSGRRAVRAWAVAEASRPGGASPEAILAAAGAAGHSVDDLADRIKARAARRTSGG